MLAGNETTKFAGKGEGPNIQFWWKKVAALARNLPALALLKNACLMFTSCPAEIVPHEF